MTDIGIGWNLSREKKPPVDGPYYVCGWYLDSKGGENKIHIIAEFKNGEWIKPNNDIGYQFTYWRELLPFPEVEDIESENATRVMNKEEAIEALKAGHRLTHRFFQEGEWIEMRDGKIYSEDGFCHDPGFWDLRQTEGDAWNTDWSIFTGIA